MNIRKQDMAQWIGNTRRCYSLVEAMEVAQRHLEFTSRVSIWPMLGQFLVVTFTSAVANR